MDDKITGWFETPFYHNVYDQYELTTDEVLLFGLIYVTTGLNRQRFFYTNKTLAQKFHTTSRTIQNRITKIKDQELIEIHIDRDGGGTYRSITLTERGQLAITPRSNLHEGGEASFMGGVKPVSYQNKTKQNKTKNINNTTNVVLEAELLSEGGKNKNTPLSESEIQKEKSSAKKEKAEYGNADINIMIEAIKSSLQLSGFKESQAQQRMAGKHLVNLAKNIGADEFKLRFVALYKDNFHRKNMGSLFYIYRQIKGFVPANNTLSSNVAKYD